MDIESLKRVNSLWKRIYPHLASWVLETCGKDSGFVLELGPFSGGIALALARLRPRFKIVIADKSSEVVGYFEEEILHSGLSGKIKIIQSQLDCLPFDDSKFDVILFRGAFFFLNNMMHCLRETVRVLKRGGMAFVGGGYGKKTPKELIEEIANESRELNNKLGRVRVSIDKVKEIIHRANVTDMCTIEEVGGLWVLIRR
jgi:ubiquinone/menaquinone biosynthesis C-methylase UbiE